MSTGFSRTSSIRVLAVLALGVIIAGCLDRVVTGPEHSDASLAARLLLVSGNSQTGSVQAALTTPVQLRVTDANGSVVKGATVSFSVRKGGGSMAPASALSGADGTVSAVWTLGSTLGAQQVMATLTGQFVVDSLTLSATATNGPASKLLIDAGDGQQAAIGTQLPLEASALVTDDFGNGVPGVQVTFRVATGGGRVDLVRSTTDSTGRMSARWTLGTVAGAQTITASLASGTLITYRATATAGLPTQLVQESGSGQTGTVGRKLTNPISIRVVDGYGNNVRGVAVDWRAEDGSIIATSALTDTLGRSLASWTLGNRVGTQGASASVSGATPVTVVAIAQAGAPTQVTLETGDKQTQTVKQTLALPLVSRVTDQFGNGVAAVPVTWAAASGGGTLLATSAATDASGRATAIWTLGSPAGSQLATLAVTGLPLTVYTATAVAAAGDSVVIEAGNNQSGEVGKPLGTPLIVRVRDTSGNPVVGTTVVFAVASGGGAMNPALVLTDANGRATSTWTLGSFVGAQTATATIGSKSLTFLATGSSAAGGGGGGGGALTPTQLVLVSGNGQNGNVSQSLGSPVVVRVIDVSGIPVTGVNVTWTLAAGNSGGFASPSISVTDGNGQATMLWTLGSKAGLQQVTVSATGVSSLTLQATAQIGSAGAVLIDNGNGQTGGTGALLPTNLRVLVVDQSGTPVIGARVNWAATVGGGTLSKASGLTDASGLDNVAWTLGATVGTQQVTATVTGLSPVTFNATASTGAGPASTPTTVVKISGDGQTAISGETLPTPLVVEVRDAAGTPLASVPVAFTTAGTGFIAPANATTGVDGRASVAWTVSSNTGTTVLTDQVSVAVGALAPVTFSATVRPALRIRWIAGGTSAVSPLMRDTTGATLSDTLEVQVYDPTGGATLGVAGKSVTWRTLAGDGNDGLAVNSVVTTDNNGRAKNRWVLRSANGLAIPPSGIAKRMVATSSGIGEVEFQARVFPGRICGVSHNSSAGSPAVGTSLSDTASVTDCNGFAVPGAAVTFVASGTGTTSPAATTTNSLGQAFSTWTLGTSPAPGVQTLSSTASAKADPYTAGGDPTYSASNSRAVATVAGAASSVTEVGSHPATANKSSSLTITVRVRDQYGNDVSGQSVSFAATGGGATAGTVSSATGTTGSGGTVSVVWTLGSDGSVSNTLTITAGGAVLSFSVTSNP